MLGKKRITDLAELKVCKVVEGNLELAENVIGSGGGFKLDEINGTVLLANAKVKQLTFLEKTRVNGAVCEFSSYFPLDFPF